jgi:hypothetical protein
VLSKAPPTTPAAVSPSNCTSSGSHNPSYRPRPGASPSAAVSLAPFIGCVIHYAFSCAGGGAIVRVCPLLSCLCTITSRLLVAARSPRLLRSPVARLARGRFTSARNQAGPFRDRVFLLLLQSRLLRIHRHQYHAALSHFTMLHDLNDDGSKNGLSPFSTPLCLSSRKSQILLLLFYLLFFRPRTPHCLQNFLESITPSCDFSSARSARRSQSDRFVRFLGRGQCENAGCERFFVPLTQVIFSVNCDLSRVTERSSLRLRSQFSAQARNFSRNFGLS